MSLDYNSLESFEVECDDVHMGPYLRCLDCDRDVTTGHGTDNLMLWAEYATAHRKEAHGN
jgi:hypothetical protein